MFPLKAQDAISCYNLEHEKDPTIQNDDFFTPILVNFLIYIILRDEIIHGQIFPTAPSYSMHILTYIYKRAGCCSCTLGLQKNQSVEDLTIKTYVYSTRVYTQLADIHMDGCTKS